MARPQGADVRRAIAPVICYPVETLPAPDMSTYAQARYGMTKISETLVPHRGAACFDVPLWARFPDHLRRGTASG